MMPKSTCIDGHKGVGSHGVVYACGSLTAGRVALCHELLGKSIRGLFAGSGQFLAVVNAWELEWQHSRDRSQVLEQETVTLGLKADVKLKHVAFGVHHRVAVTDDGQLYSWGSRDASLTQGELGQVASAWHPVTITPRPPSQDRPEQDEPQQQDAFEDRDDPKASLATSVCMPRRVHAPKELVFVKAVCGAHHSVAVTDKGDLYAWGRNFEGQLGLGSNTLPTSVDRSHNGICAWPKYVGALLKQPPVLAVSCGDRFTVALLGDGSVWRFGERVTGTSRHPEEKTSARPQCVLRGGSDDAPCTGIVCGSAHTLIVTKSGELFAWGLNTHGQLGLGAVDSREIPRPIIQPASVVWSKVFAGPHYSAAITIEGELFTWGNGHHGQLGNDSTACEFTPQSVAALRGVRIASVVCDQHNIFALAPTFVSSVSPRAGEISGGYEMRISGSGFWSSDDLTVRFVPLSEGRLPRGALARYDEDTQQIVCTVPKFSLPGEFAVEIATDGKHFTTDGHVFEAFKRPLVADVSQWEARTSGGEAITIRIDGETPRTCSRPMVAFVAVADPSRRIQVTGTVERTEVVTPFQHSEDQEEAAVTPRPVVETLLRFVSPPFVTTEPATCPLELSFNDGFVFTPVICGDSTTSSPFEFTFHDACVMRSYPNSFFTRQLPTEISWVVQHLLGHSPDAVSVTLTVTDLSVSDATADCRVEATLPVTKIDQASGTITCCVPDLPQWKLSKVDAKTGGRVEINTDWWKFAPRWGFEAHVAISMNSRRSVLPAVSNQNGGSLFGVFSFGKLLMVSPAVTPLSGGTNVAIASDFFHFDTNDASVLLTWRDRELVVPARCCVVEGDGAKPASASASARRLIFTTPALPFPSPPVKSEDDNQTTEASSPVESVDDGSPLDASEEVTLFVSLDGRTYQRESSLRIMYCRMPTPIEVAPSEAAPGTRMTIKVDGALPVMTSAPMTAYVRLTTTALGLSTVVPVELGEGSTAVEFDLPPLAVADEDTVHVLLSLDGQQFTGVVQPASSSDSSMGAASSSRSLAALAFRYRPPPPSPDPIVTPDV